jgi:hypothetical protein
MADNSIDVKFGAQITGVVDGSQAAANAVEQSVIRMKESIAGLNEQVASIGKAFNMLGQAVMVGMAAEKIYGLAEKTAEYAHNMELASQKTGMSVQSLQGWAFAASFAGGSAETLTTGMRKFSQEIVHAKEGDEKAIGAFQKLGISMKDLSNLNTEELLMRIADAFKEHADGANKSAEAVALFGRSGLNLIPILNMGSDGVKEMMKTAKDLGVIMSDDDVKAAAKFEQQEKLLTATTDGLKRKIGMELIPVLAGLAEYFQDMVTGSKEMGVGFQVLLGPIQAVISLFEGLKFVVQEVFTLIIGFVKGSVNLFGGLGSAVNKLVHRDFSGASAAMKGISADINRDLNAMGDQMVSNAQKTSDKLAQIWMGSQKKMKLPSLEKGGENEPDIPIIPKGAEGKLEEWKAELESKQMQIINGERVFNEMAVTEQQAFWERKLSLIKGNGDKEKKLREQVLNEIYNAVKREQSEELAAANEKYSTDMALAQKATEDKKAELDRQYSLGNISATQRLHQELQLEADLKSQEMEYFEAWKAIEEKKPGTAQKINEKYLAAVLKDTQKTDVDIQKSWQNVLKPMSNAFDQSLTDMLMHTKTFQQALNTIWKALLNTFIKIMVTDPLNEFVGYLAEKFQKTQLYGAMEAAWDKVWAGLKVALGLATNNQLTTIKAAASAESKAIEIPNAISEITINASTAAAGAASSQASIPYVGPALAAAAAAEMLAMVMSFASGISAAGGYDIPSGVNPVAQLHQQEMVLPKDLANRVRGMTGGGGGNTYIQALDAGSFFDRKGATIIKSMKKQLRNSHVRF